MRDKNSNLETFFGLEILVDPNLHINRVIIQKFEGMSKKLKKTCSPAMFAVCPNQILLVGFELKGS